MVFYITVLRAFAACLITNAHYTGVYPSDILANGGLLGDVIFFAVSGYCLVNIRTNFFKWYGKRLIRVYLPLLFVTVIYLFLGQYQITEMNSLFWWLVYPTYYDFASTIIILYIPYYFVMKNDMLKQNISKVMLGVLFFYLLVYFFLFDKSYYHIDFVWEHMVKFLYFESMLLGVYIRENEKRYKVGETWKRILLSIILCVLYFGSKLAFVKYPQISPLQFINQIILYMLLYAIFNIAVLYADWVENLPGYLKKVVQHISDCTLEIYLVQYVLIDLVRPKLGFPTNWIIITFSIIIMAHIVNKVTRPLVYKLSELFNC